ncbi:MAG: AhpC/TSA family protein [Colwellia sp.]|nr:AhpC/TSA family protein [Colwellia sp.]
MSKELTYTKKVHAGSTFPALTTTLLNGEKISLGKPRNGADWQLVVVYRGRHCPLCTKYLNQLETFKEKLLATGVDLVAVSGDSKVQLESHLTQLDVSFSLAYGLSVEQMKELGLYISDPRSPQETDHAFAEPGVFVVNSEGKIQLVELSNNPFVRPELQALVNGLVWIRNPDNNYPVRGMHN